MPLDPANNLAETELTASVSDTATTLPVADASVFPDADSEGAFNVLVWDANANINPSDAPDAEFVRVTSVDTTADELTVQRGQEDTPASAKESGSTVTDTWSVKDRDDIDTALNGKADDPHGNAAHTETFAVDGDAQPPEEHGNEAHSETFAVDGDTQPPEEHGDTEHDDTVPSQSDVDAKADDPHDNSAHSETFTTTDDNVEGFATEGDEGTVPTSQGDGTLAMEEAAGGEVTTVDPNEAVVGEEPTADDSNADNPLAIAVAGSALASGDNSVAIGNGTEVSGDRSIALGEGAKASSFDTVALGQNTVASEGRAVALGLDAKADGVSSVAIGRNAEALDDDSGTFGVPSGFTGIDDWTVAGDFTVGGSKDFEIDHPSKPETHDLRHGAYEGPVPGGLIYSETVEVDGSERSLDGILPQYITKDDFGTAWSDHVNEDKGFNTGYIDTDTWTLHVEEPGVYDVTLIGERDDDAATNNGKYRTEKPKGEKWNGEPRTYYREDPRFDANEYDGILRVRQKFEHTAECSPEPCEEAFAGWSVSIETEGGQREKMPGVNMDADLDVVIGAARAKIEDE